MIMRLYDLRVIVFNHSRLNLNFFEIHVKYIAQPFYSRLVLNL